MNKQETVVPPLRDQVHPSFPVVYNQFIYYFSSLPNRALFLQNPLKYVHDKPETKPVAPMQISVLGAPKSGKTYGS